MSRLLYKAVVYGYIGLCAALGLMIIWWAFIDTKPPIEHVAGKVVSFNPATQVAIVEWTAIKNRRCDGWRSGWMRETHPEPPPRLVEYLQRVRIPPAGFKGTPSPIGSVVTWRTDATIPPSLVDQDVIYVARWEYSCNLWQELLPIQVESPLIEINPQG